MTPLLQPRLPHPTKRPWLSVAEVSALTGEGEKAIRAALDSGDLPLLKLGRYKRVPTAALWRQLGLTDLSPTPAAVDSATTHDGNRADAGAN